VAALRETFEEVGLLLADRLFDPALVQPWRDRLQQGQGSMAQLCREVGLQAGCRGLIYFSHWLTPPGHPKRFDTRFFMVQAPADQVAVADLGEALELMWLTPQQALDPARPEAAAGDAAHAAGTGAKRHVAEALAAAAAHPDRTDHDAAPGTHGQGPAHRAARRTWPTPKWPAGPEGRQDVCCELLPGPAGAPVAALCASPRPMAA
jgi:8-oxo-dGTP pyrophosphatase MutT (NUDIX family)